MLANVPFLTPDSMPSGDRAGDFPALPETTAEFDFLAPPTRPGELGRLGPYRVQGILGMGGMGMVFRAFDPGLQRPIALKVISPCSAHDATLQARFLQEARAQAAVEHDNVVPIFRVGKYRGVLFFAMPLLKGQSLATVLPACPGLPLAEVLRIGQEVAQGLDAAHSIGLVHRDIKPSNIWLEGVRWRVKLLDFGLAKPIIAGAVIAPLTRVGSAPGTPGYMSPEQTRGLPVDGRSDLFSLGIVLYQLTTGERPFPAPGDSLLPDAALNSPLPPSAKNPQVPSRASDLILRLLAADPAGRPPTARCVVQELWAMRCELHQR